MKPSTNKLIKLAAELEKKYPEPIIKEDLKQADKYKTLDRKMDKIRDLLNQIKENYQIAMEEKGPISGIMTGALDVNYHSTISELNAIIGILEGAAKGLEKTDVPFFRDL